VLADMLGCQQHMMKLRYIACPEKHQSKQGCPLPAMSYT